MCVSWVPKRLQLCDGPFDTRHSAVPSPPHVRQSKRRELPAVDTETTIKVRVEITASGNRETEIEIEFRRNISREEPGRWQRMPVR